MAPQWQVKASLADGKTFASPVSCGSSGGQPAVCFTVDQNHDTGYLPTPTSADPQAIVLVHPPPTKSGSYINDVRVTVYLKATPDAGEVYQVQVNATAITCSTPTGATALADYAQIDCLIPSPSPGATQEPMTSVSVVMTNGSGNQTGSYGVREIEVYEWVPISSPQQHTVDVGVDGQGPGNDLIPNPTAVVTPVRPNGQPPASAFQSPSPLPTTNGAPVSNGSPVDFTIVLELASGQGYGP